MQSIDLSPPTNLVEVWPYIDWLDRAHYRQAPIPGPVYKRLSADQKVLVHWLCYILARQTDYRRVWSDGGPAIAELVEAYASPRGRPLDVLREFACQPATGRKIAPIRAKRQVIADEALSFTPRYSDMLFSMAITLVTLDRFGRSVAGYLWQHEKFLLSSGVDELPKRIAFLFDVLTYLDVGRQNTSLKHKLFSTKVIRHSKKTLSFFERVFGEGLKPKRLRSWFDHLRKSRQLPANAAVERLDISFRYSPDMCDKVRQGNCIFRTNSDIWSYCPPRGGRHWKGQPCPVTAYLCGFPYSCEPSGCPVRQAVPKNLCPGCRPNIREQAAAS
jgi:hypothetical protein